MTLTKRGTVVAVAVFTALALFTAACSSNADDKTETGGGTGTSTAGSDYDYASLSGTLNGSGATFPKAFYEEAIAAFGDVRPGRDRQLRRRRLGQGQDRPRRPGRRLRRLRQPHQGRRPADFKGGDVLYFPTVAAPITVSYNLTGVDRLQLSPDTLARSSRRKITTWNDPASRPTTPAPAADHADHRRRTARTARAPPRTSPSTSRPAAPSTWTLDAGVDRRVAGRHPGRQGQHRRGPDHHGDHRRHRLRRPLRRHGRKPDVRLDQEQGRQVRRPDARGGHRRRWPASTSSPT